jgi:hypothetical protein
MILTLMTLVCWFLMSSDECQVSGSAIHDRFDDSMVMMSHDVDVNVNLNSYNEQRMVVKCHEKKSKQKLLL